MSSELKPCPFCGCENVLVGNAPHSTQEFAFCYKCEAKGSPRSTKRNAIAAWNKRAKE